MRYRKTLKTDRSSSGNITHCLEWIRYARSTYRNHSVRKRQYAKWTLPAINLTKRFTIKNPFADSSPLKSAPIPSQNLLEPTDIPILLQILFIINAGIKSNPCARFIGNLDNFYGLMLIVSPYFIINRAVFSCNRISHYNCHQNLSLYRTTSSEFLSHEYKHRSYTSTECFPYRQ